MGASVIHEARVSRSLTHYDRCLLCEHRCAAKRRAGVSGPCGAGVVARVFRHRVEYGEELELIPCHLFYVSGCDLRCAFCIGESSAFNSRQGTPLSREFFRRAVNWGRKQGARTIQWVGGEPTIHIPAILAAMSGFPSLPRLIWKSNFYGTPESFELLSGVVDTYVADYKFGNNRCARRIAKVENYTDIVTRNLVLAAEQTDLIVRHLLLPGHFDCCFRNVVLWMKSNLPTVKFSVRGGYLPRWQADKCPELVHNLDRSERHRAQDYAAIRGLNLIA